MPDTEDFDKREIAAALVQSFGIVLGAATLLKCTPKTVYNYLHRYPELEEAREIGRKNRTDRAELALYKMVGDDYFAAVRFALEGSKEGRKRGWGTRPQVEVQDNRQQTLIIEKLMVRLGAGAPEDVGLGLAGLLESGDVVDGEVVEDG